MTSSSVPLTGSIVALVTPMHEDGSVDYPTLRKLIDWHIAEGTDCIGVVGTTGESPTVNVEEHCEIIRVAVEQAAKRVPIMAGCGCRRGLGGLEATGGDTGARHHIARLSVDLRQIGRHFQGAGTFGAFVVDLVGLQHAAAGGQQCGQCQHTQAGAVVRTEG